MSIKTRYKNPTRTLELSSLNSLTNSHSLKILSILSHYYLYSHSLNPLFYQHLQVDCKVFPLNTINRYIW